MFLSQKTYSSFMKYPQSPKPQDAENFHPIPLISVPCKDTAIRHKHAFFVGTPTPKPTTKPVTMV